MPLQPRLRRGQVFANWQCETDPREPLAARVSRTRCSYLVTLFEVVNALANKRIDHKAAGLMLYAMQQVSINLNNRHGSQGMCQSVKPDAPMLALEFRDFEEQYHLPKRIDLEADPETALQDAGVLPDDAARNCLLGAPPLSPDLGDRVGSTSQTPSLETVTGPQLPAGNCGITSPEQKSAKKKKKHRRRGERVPFHKGLWKVVDPNAPFRAYASDGRELTCEDAQRWQQRVWAEMQAFVDHGGAPGVQGKQRLDNPRRRYRQDDNSKMLALLRP